MSATAENQLLHDAFKALEVILAAGPQLELTQPGADPTDRGSDAFWEVRDGSSYIGTLLVEAFTRFTPRSIDRLSLNLSPAKLRRMHDPTVLVVAPWLSPRSRELIEDHGWSYLDLTGNTLIRSVRPAIYIRLAGADNDPNPRDRSEVLLRGSNINALVRLLVDVEPPYRLMDLADASGLSKGYVSRALTALYEQGLIDREGSGPIKHVNWPDLLRLRAAEYNLLGSNWSASFQARSGPRSVLSKLSDDDEAVVTGSFAAVQVAPVAAPAQLVLYVPAIRDFAQRRELHPAKSGSNVVLLQPASPSQVDRPRLVDGVPHVGYSQLVLDLLTGNGRLPDEGEAVLQWMIDTPGWRLRELPRRSQ